MAEDTFIQDMASKLTKKLDKYHDWHKTQYELYGGKWSPSSLGIAVDDSLDSKLEVFLDISRIEVDFLANQLNFDLLVGDEWNLYDYLEMGNADRVFRSAIKNSMIGSCSFVSITPGNMAAGEPPVVFTPYTGYEATGIFNSRTGKLDAGIVVNGYSANGDPNAYLLFLVDGTYEVKNNEITKLFDSKFGVQLVPFVYDQDLASRPFGRPRTSTAQKALAGSAIRTLKRAEISSEFFASPLRYLFTKLDDRENENADFMDVWNSSIGALLEVRGDSESETPQIGELQSQSPDPYIKQFAMFIEQYAANASMSPQEFGISPTNGSLSADAEAERSRKMANLLVECQNGYGEAIKQVAIHAAAVAGIDVVAEMFQMRTAWIRNNIDSDLSRIGDAMIKLFDAAPELKNTDFVYEKLGISKRSRLDRSGGLPQESSPAQRLSSLSDELKEIMNNNANNPENQISGITPSDNIEG